MKNIGMTEGVQEMIYNLLKPFGVRRCVRNTTYCLLLVSTLGYGIAVGKYQWTPYPQLSTVARSLQRWGKTDRPYEGEEEILRGIFDQRLISDECLHPPLRSLEDLRRMNEQIFVDAEHFPSAYDDTLLTNANHTTLDKGATVITSVEFTRRGKTQHAFAYGAPSGDVESRRKAVLVIPGTGHNQSSGIWQRDPKNYHFGVLESFADYDVYVFVKPNEDVLAWHNGQQKLAPEAVINWQLNQGGSYSASYIIASLAMTKYLQANYARVVVAGLSQGGGAALLNALQSKPDAAVIASGFSVLGDDVEWSSHQQIIIPGIADMLRPDALCCTMMAMDTQFLFSWGLSETGIYRMEAEERFTQRRFQHLPNVECIVFDGGHVFPVSAIREFVNKLPEGP